MHAVQKFLFFSGKDFIKCEYNRDSDNYRSPWSNEYFPPLDDGLKPLGDLRVFEVYTKFND